jgi:hypothetical protein
MAKINPSYYLRKLGSNSPKSCEGQLKCKAGSFFAEQSYGALFNLKSFNSLKKDQTNLKIFKNSSFDSSFNSVQSLNINLSHILPPLEPASHSLLQSSDKNGISSKNIKYPKISAILRAIRSIRLNRDEWKLIRYLKLIEKKINTRPPYCLGSPNKLSQLSLPRYALSSKSKGEGCPAPAALLCFAPAASPSQLLGEEVNNKNFTSEATNIISKNLLLQNMKYNFLKSTLSSILKKKIRSISEILEDKPIKNYVLYSYLKNCISLGTPPHLNGGRTKLSLNKYKGRKFGSFIYYNKIIGYKFNAQATINHLLLCSKANPTAPKDCTAPTASPSVGKAGEVKQKDIKDTYKLLFYLFKSMYCLISKPVIKYTNDKVTIQLFYYLNIPKKKVFRLFSISYISSIKNKWLALIEKKKTNFINPSSQLPSASASTAFPFAPTELGGKVDTSLAQQHCSVPALAGSGAGRLHRNNLPSSFAGLMLLRRRILKSAPMERSAQATKIYIKWKLRKAISRFKNKNGKILLFKLRKFNLTSVYQNKFKFICAILSNKFNKPVELQLIRLHHPYHDSNILVNLLSLNIKNKRKKARVAVQKIYNKKPVKFLNDPNLKSGKSIPTFLSGLNIKIAGRLMGEPIIPRITTKVFGKGAIATGKVNYLDVARITKKNRKGAYTIKITSGQNFF